MRAGSPPDELRFVVLLGRADGIAHEQVRRPLLRVPPGPARHRVFGQEAVAEKLEMVERHLPATAPGLERPALKDPVLKVGHTAPSWLNCRSCVPNVVTTS